MQDTEKLVQIDQLVSRFHGVPTVLNEPVSISNLERLQKSLPNISSEHLELLKFADGERTAPQSLKNADPFLTGFMFFYDYEFYAVDKIISGYSRQKKISKEIEWLNTWIPDYPIGTVKNTYWNPSWIPIAGSEGEYISIDGDPNEAGVIGQIIVHGGSLDYNIQVAPSLDALLSKLLHSYNNNTYLDHDVKRVIWSHQLVQDLEEQGEFRKSHTNPTKFPY